ncbi:MAG: UDP-N-acetylmuramate:L-alanyl-gamma-D-glutamyl-meso-diaminopimelate ligase [Gammaproteobacteria bacterium]|nr:UDP-N-acetylmuramate:L-alanyl-gamma-D-glutamyl-meso-diaminopimelate ligase [Gammaproteobacteria bacterium]
MRIHILGICGTFMGGIAALAKAAGHQVSGSDQNVYPPMSTQLRKLGIKLQEGYESVEYGDDIDCVVVGNVLSRGNPVVESLLNSNLPFYSGPEWLARHVLKNKWVLAVAGTHGKTTTSSMLAWILDYAGLEPGFLIGGVPIDFSISARLGRSRYFVVEADEYDTAFFDKRAKFIHYRPRTLAITNIEYDHADIYPDVDAIIRQFHQLLRTIPSEGLISVNAVDDHIRSVLDLGSWTPVETFTALPDRQATWTAEYDLIGAKSRFSVYRESERVGEAGWALLGRHNLENALAAISAAAHVGVDVELALEALSKFKGVKRRLEKRGVFHGVAIYEDFAHHPTAITQTLAALRAQQGDKRIVAIVEPRSNTMRMGVHGEALGEAFADADLVYLLSREDLGWDPAKVLGSMGQKLRVESAVDTIVDRVLGDARSGDQIVMMSNGNFGGLPRLLQQAFKSAENLGES